MPSEVRHVVFDIGGVLLGHVRTWGEARARAALEADAHFDSPEWFEATRESVLAHMSGLLAPEAWCEEVATLSAGRLTSQQARVVLEVWLDEDDYPGVSEVIEAIHAAGRDTATLSNTNPVHWEQMTTRSQALRLIRHPHASHLLGATKPELAIYEPSSGLQALRVPRCCSSTTWSRTWLLLAPSAGARK